MGNEQKTILIVEDSPDLQSLLKQVIAGEGHNVFCASNGKQALDLLQKNQDLPSLILLDLMMPVMDGFEFRKAQLQDARLATVPVVIMTADSNPESKTRDLHPLEIVKKPLTIERVIEIVDRHAI